MCCNRPTEEAACLHVELAGKDCSLELVIITCSESSQNITVSKACIINWLAILLHLDDLISLWWVPRVVNKSTFLPSSRCLTSWLTNVQSNHQTTAYYEDGELAGG